VEQMRYTITDPSGIHARPAGLLVQAARAHASTITIRCRDRQADCKKLLQLMQMDIQCGDEIIVTAEGDDAADALEELEQTMRKAGL